MKKERKDKQFIKKPYYLGGITAMKAFIKKHLVYPDAARAQKIEGTVYTRYTINYKGQVVDAKIISGIGYGCDEEAIRLVKLLTFVVPKNRKLKVIFHKDLQIHFRLPKEQPKEISDPLSNTSIQYNYTAAKKVVNTPKQPPKKGGSYDITIAF